MVIKLFLVLILLYPQSCELIPRPGLTCGWHGGYEINQLNCTCQCSTDWKKFWRLARQRQVDCHRSIVPISQVQLQFYVQTSKDIECYLCFFLCRHVVISPVATSDKTHNTTSYCTVRGVDSCCSCRQTLQWRHSTPRYAISPIRQLICHQRSNSGEPRGERRAKSPNPPRHTARTVDCLLAREPEIAMRRRLHSVI